MSVKNSDVIKVKCPTCLADVIFSELSPFRPFCSKRCQLIDLGEWAEERKTIPGSPIIDENELWQNELDCDEPRQY